MPTAVGGIFCYAIDHYRPAEEYCGRWSQSKDIWIAVSWLCDWLRSYTFTKRRQRDDRDDSDDGGDSGDSENDNNNEYNNDSHYNSKGKTATTAKTLTKTIGNNKIKLEYYVLFLYGHEIVSSHGHYFSGCVLNTWRDPCSSQTYRYNFGAWEVGG